MIDYEVNRCTRRCAVTDREFTPGEVIYSALIAEGKDVVRRDYSLATWSGPPAGAIGWWKGAAPEPTGKKASLAPGDVLVGYFEELTEDPTRADVCYLLALLLIRRKLFRQDRNETDAAGQEWMNVINVRTEGVYRIPIAMPSPQRMTQVEQELTQLIHADAGSGGSAPS